MTDEADREAQRLLPCAYRVRCTAATCPTCERRPTIAAALRARDERIAELEQWAEGAMIGEGGRQAELVKLLPCKHPFDPCIENHHRRDWCSHCERRPAIADALRVRDKKIAELECDRARLDKLERWWRRHNGANLKHYPNLLLEAGALYCVTTAYGHSTLRAAIDALEDTT